MSVTLTVNLDSDALQFAEQVARARDTTLPEVAAHQLRLVACDWQDSRGGKAASGHCQAERPKLGFTTEP